MQVVLTPLTQFIVSQGGWTHASGKYARNPRLSVPLSSHSSMKSILKSLKSIFFAGACLWLFVQGSSCKSPIVPPEIDPGPDTTSHEFVWQIDTIGAQGVLYDAAIIDENNIWAVGEIYLRDSSGQIDPKLYNVAQWDGVNWTPRRVTVNFRANLITPAVQGIFAFSQSDIWLAASGSVIHGNGSSWTLHDVRLVTGFDSLSFTKTWGTSSENMYFVGRSGSIAYYNGVNWQKIESGTTLDIWDIWGGNTGSNTEIVAIGNNGPEKDILRISNNGVDTVSDAGIPESVVGVWFSPGRKYVIVGSGIFRKRSLSEPVWTGAPLELTEYFSNAVCGTDTNNVVVAGAYGDLLHYNGSTWKRYPELLMTNGSYYAVSCSGKSVAAVGHVGSRAIALTGMRQ